MFHKLRNICFYITVSLVMFVLRKPLQSSKIKIGGINFYGPDELAVEFEKAIRIELPKYDLEMSKRILTKNISLNFFYSDQFEYYFPQCGLFFAAKWAPSYGTENVCQYIVYCVISSDYTGIGLNAAMNLADPKRVQSNCMKAMSSWIIEKKFPEKWLSSYQTETTSAPSAK